MTQNPSFDLDGVAETLLFPLYMRALESARPDALLKDPRAEALVARMGTAFERIRQVSMDQDDQVALILRNREFDRRVRAFLALHPGAVAVHIGCGLDARFERVDDGLVEWYDLDLPQVIELRRNFIGGESGRCHLIGASAFEEGWLDVLNAHAGRPLLFLAEGVFMYFEEAQVRALVLTLQRRFPGAELVFDAFSPYLVRMNNLRFRFSPSKITARYRWGLKDAGDLETWAPGITLLERWYPFDSPEPRLEHVRWVRHIPFLAHVMGVYQYRLGEGVKPV